MICQYLISKNPIGFEIPSGLVGMKEKLTDLSKSPTTF